MFSLKLPWCVVSIKSKVNLQVTPESLNWKSIASCNDSQCMQYAHLVILATSTISQVSQVSQVSQILEFASSTAYFMKFWENQTLHLFILLLNFRYRAKCLLLWYTYFSMKIVTPVLTYAWWCMQSKMLTVLICF